MIRAIKASFACRTCHSGSRLGRRRENRDQSWCCLRLASYRVAAGRQPDAGGCHAAGRAIRFRRSWIEALAVHAMREIAPDDDAAEYLGTSMFVALLTVAGVAFAVPMMVLGIFWRDAINEMIDLQFNLVERGKRR